MAHHHHPIAVGAPRQLAPGSARPFLLQRDDDDFIAAVLAELADGRTPALADTRARDRAPAHGNALKLYQPTQRRFHLALIEACCDIPGHPRVDPARVDAAGLVLRRVRPDGGMEGWMKAKGVIRGWTPVARLADDGAAAERADPLPAMRLALRDTGAVQVDRALRALRASHDTSLLEEDVTPMFVAPPDVCAATGQSVYYGVVSTASAERAQAEPDIAALFAGFEATSAGFRDHLVQPLKGQAWTFPTPPQAGRRFDAGWLQALQEAPSPSDAQRLLLLLRQLASEFDLFGEAPASVALRAALSQVRLTYGLRAPETVARTVDATTFLREAVRVLFEDGTGSVELPLSWPALPVAGRDALARAMHAAMLARFRTVKGRPGRFDDPDAHYRIRAFVRLKPEGGCPARTVWSDYGEPFVIAPWYEGGADPIQIALPNLAAIKTIKPNVSFCVPQDIQNKIGDPKDLLEGKPGNNGFTVGWICSFSIPVITLCAFIVLNLFLSLFDIFLRWMMFIKICIPYPKAK